MERLKRFWGAFKDFAIIFSFATNFFLIVALLISTVPGLQAAFALKTGLLEPLLHNLDAAFISLGEATIATTVKIDQRIPIQFDQPLDEPLDINFPLHINQDTVVELTAPVPLNLTFSLPGGGGSINGTIQLPRGLRLPIHLDMIVPVAATIPVRMTVPISQSVPIQMDVPVQIKLGESGLDPVVQQLRGAIEPVRVQVDRLPDGIELSGGEP